MKQPKRFDHMSEGERLESGYRYGEDRSGTPFEFEEIHRLIRPVKRIEIDGLRQALESVVKSEVIPQLILAEKSALLTSHSAKAESRDATTAEVDAFQVLIIHRNTSDCFEFVSALKNGGLSLRSIYLGLFAPVAQQLGTKWDNDELSFVDVTIALNRLQTLLHDFAEPTGQLDPLDAARRIVLASSPDEQHALGMLIVSELFRMKGWDVSGGPGLAVGTDLNSMVNDNWYGVVGLSAGTEERARQLKSEIDNIRRASRNQAISVLVGGPGFIEHPEISMSIGADGVAGDADDAVSKAQGMIDGKSAAAKQDRASRVSAKK
ncbi:MAG TPA: cobalamin B12-binding domain-containing protein [Saliniramus sp.]|nr:cobalamin B12-binding domain-containing protein [Saliniramus sp.]